MMRCQSGYTFNFPIHELTPFYVVYSTGNGTVIIINGKKRNFNKDLQKEGGETKIKIPKPKKITPQRLEKTVDMKWVMWYSKKCTIMARYACFSMPFLGEQEAA